MRATPPGTVSHLCGCIYDVRASLLTSLHWANKEAANVSCQTTVAGRRRKLAVVRVLVPWRPMLTDPVVVSKMVSNHLFYVSRADIFSVYPEILREILVLEELLCRTKPITAFGHTITASDRVPLQLPSEFEWQLKQYFRLLEQQKKINAATEQGM